MSDDLYFIPIIVQALQQRNPEESLRQAFDKIRYIGLQPRYKLGLEQFDRFMATVKAHLKKGETKLLETKVIFPLHYRQCLGMHQRD